MQNYFIISEDKEFLHPEVQGLPSVPDLKEYAQLLVENRINRFGLKDAYKDAYDPDASNVTNERLKKSIKLTIARVINGLAYSRRDVRVAEYEDGERSVEYGEGPVNRYNLLDPFLKGEDPLHYI